MNSARVKSVVKPGRGRFDLKGLKLTHPREVIVEKILATKAGEHFSADELWERLRRKQGPVSKATVYRTLSLLVQKKIVEEHDFGRGQKYYERLAERPHHDHLICVHCGRIIEFGDPEIERLQEEVARRENFVIAYHSHKLFGACSRCHHKRKRTFPNPA